MNLASPREALVEKKPAPPTSIKVCMHLPGAARTDYRVLRDAATLVEAGFEVSIVDVESERTRPVEESIDGIRLKHVIMPDWFAPSPAYFKLWFLIKFALMVIRCTVFLLQTPADIYHAHTEKAIPACYIAARLRRKPFILDTPELTMSYQNFTRWRKLTKLAIYLLRRIVPHCAGYITGSPLYAQEFQTLYHAPEVTVVRHVPPYRSVQKTNRLHQCLNLDPGTCIALYQGYLQHDRGLEMLVHAAPFLKPCIVIVMMGKGKGTTQSQLETLIASEGVADRVKIIPPVPYEELLEWTASAHIGLTILPPNYALSIRLCLPNKFFEYLMAGLPVLTSQLDAVVEVVRTYDVGQVVPSLAPAGIGAAINAMLADSDALARMSRNALEAAKHEFYWEKESQKLVQVYQTILTK